MERSRSGNGAHVWIFFGQPLQASLARKLGAFFLTQTMKARPEIGLDSYDRFFPNQDTMPSGGYGNLIALPLQRMVRNNGNSAFVDELLQPYPNQMAFLASVRPAAQRAVETIVEQAQRHGDIVGVRMVATDDEFDDKPWTLPPSQRRPNLSTTEKLPLAIEIVLANQVFIPKADIPPQLLNELIRIAAFQNPEFYKAQAMRFSTFDKPRIVACAENFAKHIALPRGCLDDAMDLLKSLGIAVEIVDERCAGTTIDANFVGELREGQKRAVASLLKHDTGVLAVPTAFGKTVVAARMIAERGVSTLVLLHRKQLVDQWKERLTQFLDLDPKLIGQIGGGKNRPTGIVDLATIQTLNRKGVVDDVVANYGHLIVDECHHLSAYSFERVARASKARYVLGLSATPARRDGHHPIIFMQCGPVRFHIDPRIQAAVRPFDHRVVVRPTSFAVAADDTPPVIQTLYGLLVADDARNEFIVKDVAEAVAAGRSPLVLTERTEHVETLAEAIKAHCPNVFTLRGGMGIRERRAVMAGIRQIPPDAPRVLVGTGRYIGEGFDDARLDTLFLALPISWTVALAQYAGRLHREYDNKREVIVYDCVDEAVPMLARMFGKRKVGYRAIGYRI
ncbi:MAG: DEAD/DEAH box helicase family protein [Capsulimonadaceae bacterium]|nr:DEAD/DEAH box helicase family protein [Capsulimonadaceae bacterium]